MDNLLYLRNDGTGRINKVAGQKAYYTKYSQDIGDGVNVDYTVGASILDQILLVTVFENSTGNVVHPDITIGTDYSVALSFTTAPTANQFKVVIIG